MALGSIDRINGGATLPPDHSVTPDAQAPERTAPPDPIAFAPVQGQTRNDTADITIDPLVEIEELAAGRGSVGPTGGLAQALLDWVTPQPRHPEALAPSRILPLLGLAVDRLSRPQTGADAADLEQLGARALGHELQRHRDLAERRATLIEP